METVKASAKCVMYFTAFDSCHWLASLWMLDPHHFDIHIQGQAFSSSAFFTKKMWNDSGCQRHICLNLHVPRCGVALVDLDNCVG